MGVGNFVGMGDSGRKPGCVEKHRNERGVLGQSGVQAFDGDCTGKSGRATQAAKVHRGHTSGGDLPKKQVPPNGASTRSGGNIRHGDDIITLTGAARGATLAYEPPRELAQPGLPWRLMPGGA